jgi:hypothetical protein
LDPLSSFEADPALESVYQWADAQMKKEEQ